MHKVLFSFILCSSLCLPVLAFGKNQVNASIQELKNLSLNGEVDFKHYYGVYAPAFIYNSNTRSFVFDDDLFIKKYFEFNYSSPLFDLKEQLAKTEEQMLCSDYSLAQDYSYIIPKLELVKSQDSFFEKYFV